MIEIQYHKTKIGEFILGSYNNKLCLLDFRYRKMRTIVDNRLKQTLNTEFEEKENALLNTTKKQIEEYLLGEREEFDLPTLLVGSDFQKSVWEALLNIKYGDTASYLDIAKAIHNKKAVRAVAAANGANAIAIIIPCHRVIGSDGKLTGYGGGLTTKKRLLNLENKKLYLQTKLEL